MNEFMVAGYWRSGSPQPAGEGARFVGPGSISPFRIDFSRHTVAGVPERSAENALSCDDVVVGLRGSSNPAASVDVASSGEPVFATLDVAIGRVSEKLRPKFLAWYLNLPSTQALLAPHRAGAGAARLPLSALTQLTYPVTTIDRQDMIVAVVELAQRAQELSSQIEAARTRLVNELLRRAAREEGPAPGCTPARAEQRPAQSSTGSGIVQSPDRRK